MSDLKDKLKLKKFKLSDRNQNSRKSSGSDKKSAESV
jgi:hypothetical protein